MPDHTSTPKIKFHGHTVSLEPIESHSQSIPRPSLQNSQPAHHTPTETNTPHASSPHIPLATLRTTIKQAILTTAEQTKQRPIAPPFYQTAITAAAAATAAATNHDINGVPHLLPEVWLRHPHAPRVFIDGATNQDLDAEQFIEHFDAQIHNNSKEMLDKDRMSLHWNEEQCRMDTLHATGGSYSISTQFS